ncbi:MAG: methyltransferase domain-containing protein [Desulfoprunum sp.]|jgi:SAM-dependent methyltransferase|uniref:class I SAM-dependent methyltransferase n=1 Tax=Desulfoprunum sp. TaxID=2020866 RepID=UPI003C70BD09
MEYQAFEQDLVATLRNREALFTKPNLLYWYGRLYERLFGDPQSASELRILEIGSGMSPLKHFYPTVITSDIMPLDHVDHVFDAHRIDRVTEIAPSSLDVITLTNVLHHLWDPIAFLLKARGRLRPGGRIILVEPYYSRLSRQIYTRLHHEPSDFSIQSPRLPAVAGPLSTANMAIPYLIFCSDRGWERELRRYYRWDQSQMFYYTALAYMMTGGVARKIPLPSWFYNMMFTVDSRLADRFPALVASFFCLTLKVGDEGPAV